MLRQICFIQLLCMCSIHAQEVDLGLQNTGTNTEAAADTGSITAADANTGINTAAADTGTGLDTAAADTGIDTAATADTGINPAAEVGTGPEVAAADAGVDTAAAVDAGVDTAAVVDAGVDTAAVVDTGVDTAAAVDTGVDTAAAVDAGVDTAAVVDTGADTAAVVDTGVDTAAAVDTGVDTAAVDAGVDTAAAVDAGVDTAAAVDAGVDTAAAADTGAITAAAEGTDPVAANTLTEGTAPVVEAAAVNDAATVINEGTEPVVAVADTGADPVQDPASVQQISDPGIITEGQAQVEPVISSEAAAPPSVEIGSELPAASNPAASVVSSAAQADSTNTDIANKDPPIVKMGKGTYSVTIGEGVTMECNIISDSNIKDVQWIRNGKIIQSSSTAPAGEVNGKTYTLKNAQEEDKGYYTCKAYNLFGSASDLTILKVEPKSAARKTVQRNAHRVIGGVGGGGFGPQKKSKLGPCAWKCAADTASCYNYHNCTHYEHCYTRLQSCVCTPMRCSPGTLWDKNREICGFHYDVKCKDDPCRNKHLKAYTDGFNCKLYYRCKENGYSEPVCCPNSMSFDNITKECVLDDSCGNDVGCMVQPSAVNEVGNKPENKSDNVCRLRPVKGDNTKYYDITSKLFVSCSPGTVYRPGMCTCNSPTNQDSYPIYASPNCNPTYYTSFNGSKIKNEAPMHAWMGPYNVKLVKTDDSLRNNTPAEQYGHFNGRTSKVEMPYFKSKAVNNILIQIRFYTESVKGPVNQVLMSNCQTVKPIENSTIQLSPSIAIVLDRVKKHLVFMADTGEKSGPAVMILPFKVGDWNNVEFMFNGKIVRATVLAVDDNNKGKTKKSEDIKELKGKIKAPITSLQLGGCKDDDGFYGYIDMIKVYDCIPTVG